MRASWRSSNDGYFQQAAHAARPLRAGDGTNTRPLTDQRIVGNLYVQPATGCGWWVTAPAHFGLFHSAADRPGHKPLLRSPRVRPSCSCRVLLSATSICRAWPRARISSPQQMAGQIIFTAVQLWNSIRLLPSLRCSSALIELGGLDPGSRG